MEPDQSCIVAGTDFSDGALEALREGRWLAARAGLPLQVVHVARNGMPWHTDPAAREWLEAASLHPSSVVVRRGLAWVEIVRHAREVSAALIVLGSHGASGLQRMTLGSTASKVVLGAPCPVVFVARPRARAPFAGTSIPLPNLLEEKS